VQQDFAEHKNHITKLKFALKPKVMRVWFSILDHATLWAREDHELNRKLLDHHLLSILHGALMGALGSLWWPGDLPA
jgi:hypothetical protein